MSPSEPRTKSFYARFSLPILMAFFFATPLLFQGARQAIRSNTNKVVDWLPKTFRETTELRWFRQHFVADQFVVISWDGCTLGGDPRLPDAEPDDPRIERLARFLVPDDRPAPEHGQPAGYKGMFQSVTTARHLLDDLTAKPSEVPYPEAKKRLRGTLIGPDGRQTCVVVMLSDAAIKNFRAVVGRHVANGSLPWQRKPGVLFEALAQCGIDTKAVRLGGPPVENVAIDEEGGRTLARLGTISGLLGLMLAYWSLRSVRLTVIVFGCGILSAAAGLAVVNWSGQTMDAVLMSMPSLLYVLAISGAVHLINYYRDAVAEHGLERAPERAIGHGWKPALMCSVTTAVGLGSLYVSDIEPIRKFGVYSATGVMLMLVMLFLFLPAALQQWPLRISAETRRRKERDAAPTDIAAHGALWSDQAWMSVSGLLIRRHVVVMALCAVLIAGLGWGVTRTRTSIDLLKLFDQSVRVRKDYAWLEQHIGRLVPLEVVVEFPADMLRPQDANVDADQLPNTLSFLERLEVVSLIQQTIDDELGPDGSDLVGPSMSAVTFAPPLPTGRRDVWSVSRRSVTNDRLEASENALADSGYLTTNKTGGTELWRISLRAAAFADLDYGQFVESVREEIEPVLAAQRVRELVLQRLIDQRGDESLAGASICIWDRAVQPALAEQPDQQDERSADSAANQQRILVESAERLLSSARFKLTHTSLDFAQMPAAAKQQLLAQLRDFDSVVLIGGFTDADVQELQQAGVSLADARHLLAERMRESLDARVSADSVSAVYTGVVPIVYKAQRALLDNLIQSTTWSFIMITPLLMLVSRSVMGGAVAMLPNVLPVLMVFGGMGWLGFAIDIGSMMSASVALGVAVDDTIHFLTWYREDLKRLANRRAAIQSAYRRCGPPTLQAALISGLGLSVFVFSTFTPTQRLGWLMMTILLTGVVAELVMLPALLAGPLGLAFRVRPEKPSSSSSSDDHAMDGERATQSLSVRAYSRPV